jgi:hypothetical protein
MPTLRNTVLVLAIAASLVSAARATAAAHTGPAPADEYFGPFHESILGIRNHLVDLERKNDGELREHIRGIDNEEVACEAWERQYPNDRWLPGFFSRILTLYARGDARNATRARRATVYLQEVQRGLRP